MLSHAIESEFIDDNKLVNTGLSTGYYLGKLN